VPAPATALRPDGLVWPEHQERKLERAEIDLESLVAKDFDLDVATLGRAPDELLAPAQARLAELLAELETVSAPVANEMEKAVAKTGDNMRRALEQFTGRLTAALGRADEVRRGRLARLSEWVRPEGELQERVLSTADLPGRYGGDLVDALFEQMELDGGRLHLVSP
jgi:hypothetical protein